MAPALFHVAALALRASSIVPSCPQLPTCPQDDKCTFGANNDVFQVSCGTDFYGGDLVLAQTVTLASCMTACSTTSGCVAVSYVGGNCYMKQILGAPQANSNVIGAALIESASVTTPTESAPPMCPAAYNCPENNGCMIQSSNDRAFVLTCGRDFYGGDFDNLSAPSYAACAQACTDNVDCVAASYVGGKGPGHCYLKNTNNGASTNENVDAISFYSRVVSQPSAAPSAIVTISSSSLTQQTSTASVTAAQVSSNASSDAVSSSSVVQSSSTIPSTPLATLSPTPSSTTASSSSSSSPAPISNPNPIACFTITGHGRPDIEGKSLNMIANNIGPNFGAEQYGYLPEIYGLHANGELSAISPFNQGRFLSTEGVNIARIWRFYEESGTAKSRVTRAICKIDASTRKISCCEGDGSLCNTTSSGYVAVFGQLAGSQYSTITMTYNLVTCPA